MQKQPECENKQSSVAFSRRKFEGELYLYYFLMEITIYYTLCVAHGTSKGTMFLIKLKFRAVEQSFSYTMRYRLSCLSRLPANGHFWCLFLAVETNLSCT